MAAEEGVALTKDQIKALAKKGNREELSAALRAEFDRKAITDTEGKAIFTEKHPEFVASAEHVAAVTGEISEEEAEKKAAELVDAETFSGEEFVALAAREGVTLTPEQIAAEIGQRIFQKIKLNQILQLMLG